MMLVAVGSTDLTCVLYGTPCRRFVVRTYRRLRRDSAVCGRLCSGGLMIAGPKPSSGSLEHEDRVGTAIEPAGLLCEFLFSVQEAFPPFGVSSESLESVGVSC
jgi:hypothetical protein